MTTSTPLARAGTAIRRWCTRFSLPGLVLALVFFTVSLGPALTPRSAVFQGGSAGICAAIGYGLGTAVWSVARRWRALADLATRVRRPARWTVALAAPVVVVAGLVWSANWQRRLRALMGMDPAATAQSVLTLLVALALALALLQVARGLRVSARALARLLDRAMPAVVSRLLAVVVVGVVTVLVVNGVAVRAGLDAMEHSFAVLDDQTFPGNEQPTSADRSGSAASTQAWDTLGREGRRFVSTGPTPADLAAFDATAGLHRTDLEPIRVYAGRTSAPTLAGVAANVVKELDRTHAWDRSVLVVTTTTGTGWVDPPSARAIELLRGGDTAIAAMQYSYLPSWVSFVGDRATPVEAGKALLAAVRARWLQLPADHRPQLDVFGISLGSFGSQGAFTSLDDVLSTVDGAVWAGTPSFTPLWQQLTADRDPGSRQIDPVLDGGAHVRWGVSLSGSGDDLFALGTTWQRPRVVYLQHASDGVTWWSPDLLFERPDWSREPRGPDVLDDVRWTPIVSFWQLTIDLFVAADAPSGHGHTFEVEYADAWAAVAAPDGWTTADTVALRAALAAA